MQLLRNDKNYQPQIPPEILHRYCENPALRAQKPNVGYRPYHGTPLCSEVFPGEVLHLNRIFYNRGDLMKMKNLRNIFRCPLSEFKTFKQVISSIPLLIHKKKKKKKWANMPWDPTFKLNFPWNTCGHIFDNLVKEGLIPGPLPCLQGLQLLNTIFCFCPPPKCS